MSFNSEYAALRRKRKKEEEENIKKKRSTESSFAEEYAALRAARSKERTAAVAPIAGLTDNEERAGDGKWFKSGALKDGYTPGDITKSVASTVGDIGINAAKGLLGMGEGVTDLIGYGVAEAADALGKKDFAEDLRYSLRKNVVDGFFAPAEDAVDKNSFFGDKTDAVSQGVGQVAGMYLTGGLGASAGLSSAGVSALTTGSIFASSMGSGIGEALDSGADRGEAWGYGALAGAAEAGSELIFGGLGKTVNALGISRGISSLDDIFAKKLSQRIANQTVKNIAEYGVKASAEGVEEVISGLGSAIAKKLTYMSDENIKKLVDDEGLLDQFIVGAVTSGLVQSGYIPGTSKGSLREANRAGRDFVTGYTQAEQNVIDREVSDRIAERERNGGKLTKNERGRIREAVQSDFERGYISTDVIEDVLASDAYREWKAADERESGELKEYERLADTPYMELSLNQRRRLESLESRLDSIKEKPESTKLRRDLDSRMSELLKESRLGESYNERSRRHREFTADTSIYKSEAARQTVQNLIDSKYANDTGRTHDFADALAKISESRGTVYSFTNNEQIEKSGRAYRSVRNFNADGTTKVFDLDTKRVDSEHPPTVKLNGREIGGYSVDYDKGTLNFYSAPKSGEISVEYTDGGIVTDGFRTKDGITLNLDSPRAWEYVVGHETTHTLEGTKEWSEYRDAIIDWAKDRGDYRARYDSYSKLYNDGTDIDAEVAADLSGTYLFSDSDFINDLCASHRNIFQKVYDQIKYYLKLVTAGSKEARQLERAKHLYEEAWKAAGKTDADAEIKYSLTGVNDDGIEVYETSQSVMDLSWKDRKAKYLDIMRNEYRGRKAKFERNGHTYYAEFDENSLRKPIYGDSRSSVNGKKALVKAGADGDIFDLVENSQYKGSKENYKNHTDADYFDYYIKTVQIDGKVFDLIADVERKYSSDDGYVYTLALKDNKTVEASPTHSTAETAPVYSAGNASTNNSISQNTDLSTDTAKKVDATAPIGKSDASDTQYSLSRTDERITSDTSDEARARILENSEIRLAEYDGKSEDLNYKNISALKTAYGANANRYLRELGEKFGVFKTYSNDNVSLEFDYSRGSLRESINKQNKVHTDYSDFAKMLYVFDDVVKNAVPVEVHDDKYKGTARENTNLKQDYVLLSAFKEGDYITPVELHIKEMKEKTGVDNRLYVSVTLGKIKIEDKVSAQISYTSNEVQTKDARLSSAISIPELIANVNPQYGNFYKYFPASMLSEEQNRSRDVAIGDENYRLEVMRGEDVSDILSEKAKENGYSTDDSWKMDHRAPNSRDGYSNSIDNIDKSYGSDGSIYSSGAVYYYGEGRDYDSKAISVIKSARNNPEKKITVYRAVPTDVKDSRMRNGDWVAIVKEYAAEHGDRVLDGNYRIIENTVPAKYLFSNGDSINEWGYDNGNTNEVYKNTENNVKTLDVTYDDGGGIIPLSKRFNENKNDPRYSLTETGAPLLPIGTPMQELRVENENASAPLPIRKDAHRGMKLPLNVTDENVAPIRDVRDRTDAAADSRTEGEAAPRVARILTEEPAVDKPKRNIFTKAMTNFADKGWVFENLAKKTKNRRLEGLWNYALPGNAEARAQHLIGNGTDGVRSLADIQSEVEKSGKTNQFYEYMYHQHNIDRMSLESEENRIRREELRKGFDGLNEEQINTIAEEPIGNGTSDDTEALIKNAREYVELKQNGNKPVFGSSVTADMSRDIVSRLERANPEFKKWAKDVYDYSDYLMELMVDGNVISQETADMLAKKYPHYVPIRRLSDEGLTATELFNGNAKRTGVNAPIKRATGGSLDIMPLFETLGARTEQAFKAAARNKFGVELMNTLGSEVNTAGTTFDEVMNSVDTNENMLIERKPGRNPQFTVFDNGNRVTFDITDDMYDALKPKSDGLAYKNKLASLASSMHRAFLTEYNPVFMATNAVKDIQDVLMNSQHAAKTYATVPKAIRELATGGRWYTEYMESGGAENTYFEGDTRTFTPDDSKVKQIIGMPLNAISAANNFIEKVPRLAEYIASRESGRSIEVSMLDAARVTTNFAAGGDYTKFLNRNGASFLNASVQGAMQQIRNIREAKMNGLRGWVSLAAKVAAAGLPAVLLNNLLWDDDDDYEELSDYVKQNYYVVAKYGDGKFVRIPKGRTLAVIQNGIEQIENAATGNDEADLASFLDLAVSNLAPNNPIDNNIVAPIAQVINNKTWYGEDLVPTRLQNVPAAEQYDENTDAVSKWLGEKINVSPYKINYLLNQYSGGVGDVVLPMMTPKAENATDSKLGKLIAPFTDKFTTDSVINNQNVSDFHEKVDEATVAANSIHATDEDKLRSKFLNSANSEIGKLYTQKREIQSSDLPDSQKHEEVRAVQRQIVERMKSAMESCGNVSFEDDYREGGRYARVGSDGNELLYKLDDSGEWNKVGSDAALRYNVTRSAGNGSYATDGVNQYRWYVPEGKAEADGSWQKISDSELRRQNEVTRQLGIAPSEYWSHREEYNFAADNPAKYALAKSVGGYDRYRSYVKSIGFLKADRDADGNAISGSRRQKVFDYIGGLDADYGVKMILWRNAYKSDDTYNYDIVEYLNGLDDITYSEMELILKELDFEVSADGMITWR